MAFVPVIENDIGQNMVISDEPWVLLKNSKIPDIPVICGSVLDEGSTLPPRMIFNQIFDSSHKKAVFRYFEIH